MILYHAGGKKYVGCANPIRETPPSLDMFQNMPAKANQPIPSEASVDLRDKTVLSKYCLHKLHP